MANDSGRHSTARLLLFERDPGKRHYFHKYVLGILWRGLSEEEKHHRLLEALRHRRRSNVAVGGTAPTELLRCTAWIWVPRSRRLFEAGDILPPRPACLFVWHRRCCIRRRQEAGVV